MAIMGLATADGSVSAEGAVREATVEDGVERMRGWTMRFGEYVLITLPALGVQMT